MTKNEMRQIHQAFIEGRKCSRCGWMITKTNWKKGNRECMDCKLALKGVNVRWGHVPFQQEFIDELEMEEYNDSYCIG